MSHVFDSYSAYYDLLYKDKNYAAGVQYIDGLLKKFGQNLQSLVEFGSGTGIHGRLLAEKNYHVTGIELSPQMVARAKTTERFSCQQGDIREVHLNKTYDAALSLFHVMSYQVTNSDILAAMSSASAHVKVGGLFIFDFWYTPAVHAQKPESRVKLMESSEVKVTRYAEPRIYPNENRVDVHYKVLVEEVASRKTQTLNETHSMRHFSLPEIDLLARFTGFEFLHAEEFLTAAVPSEKTWGVCVVLRKVKK